MTTDIRKLTPLVTDDLEPGETLLAAVKASPAGQAHQQILGMAGMSQLGVPGAIAGSRIGERWSEAGRAARADARARRRLRGEERGRPRRCRLGHLRWARGFCPLPAGAGVRWREPYPPDCGRRETPGRTRDGRPADG